MVNLSTVRIAQILCEVRRRGRAEKIFFCDDENRRVVFLVLILYYSYLL